MTKIATIESDRNEHILVEDSLRDLDGDRRAYRYVTLVRFVMYLCVYS